MTRQTELEDRVFNFIKDYIKEHEYPPSLVEIARAVGMKSPRNVMDYLGRLEKHGRIKRLPRAHRSIQIVQEAG